MTMTDPIADMLTRIRNANTAHFDTVSMPGSKLKESLAAILVDEGYIGGFQVSDTPGKPGRTLQITMKYAPDRANSPWGPLTVTLWSSPNATVTPEGTAIGDRPMRDISWYLPPSDVR